MHLMCCTDQYDHHHGCPSDHFQTLCTIFGHAALVLSHHDPLIKWLWTWMQETQFTHKNWITQWTSTWNKFPMSLALHINLFHEQNLSHWYLRHLLHLTPIKSATSYLKIKSLTKMLYTREPYYWTCLATGTLLEYIYTHWHYLQHLQYLPQNSVPFHPNTSRNINSTLQLHKFPSTTQQHL